MNSIELSIIIVNFNGKKYLEDCFNSIYKQTFGINIEVIVFDNNSSDDSVRYIKKNYP
ncbi:MAG: glycosyltransferase family 2 protein, partial [Flavobacteriaceae bacterium]